MSGVMSILLILGLALFVSVECDLDCKSLPDGHYNIGCKTYEVCEGGKFYSVECGLEMVYNNETMQCDPESTVLPPCGLVRDCTNMEDGRYADVEHGCTSYYTCNYHVYFGHNFCAGNLVFENSLALCVYPADAYPPCGTKVDEEEEEK